MLCYASAQAALSEAKGFEPYGRISLLYKCCASTEATSDILAHWKLLQRLRLYRGYFRYTCPLKTTTNVAPLPRLLPIHLPTGNHYKCCASAEATSDILAYWKLLQLLRLYRGYFRYTCPLEAAIGEGEICALVA